MDAAATNSESTTCQSAGAIFVPGDCCPAALGSGRVEVWPAAA